MDQVEPRDKSLKPSIEDLGRPLDDNEWLSNLIGNVLSIIGDKKIRFKRRKTPSVVYLLRSEIKKAVDRNLYVLEGCETTAEIINRLIGSVAIDRDLATQSLNTQVKRLYLKDVPSLPWQKDIWRHDLQGELDDSVVIKNELSKFQTAVLTDRRPSSNAGLAKPPLLLGTFSTYLAGDPISSDVLSYLQDSQTNTVNLGAVGAVNAFKNQNS